MPLVACRLPEMMKDKGPIWDRLVQASSASQGFTLALVWAPDFSANICTVTMKGTVHLGKAFAGKRCQSQVCLPRVLLETLLFLIFRSPTNRCVLSGNAHV